jgi:hypothetical protein
LRLAIGLDASKEIFMKPYIESFIYYSKLFIESCQIIRLRKKLDRGEIGLGEFYTKTNGELPF